MNLDSVAVKKMYFEDLCPEMVPVLVELKLPKLVKLEAAFVITGELE